MLRHLYSKTESGVQIFPGGILSPSSRLTNFADFGFSPEMTHRGQVQVTVFVYQCNFPVSGWATLIQSYFHHLQLHIKK